MRMSNLDIALIQVHSNSYFSIQNLKFGRHVEPDNEEIKKKLAWAEEMRGEKLPSVPSTIGEEKKINPFMRVNEAGVQKHANSSDGVATMAFIRKEKDSFKA